MFKSLKNRLLVWFLLLAFVIACIIFPVNYFHKKRDSAIRANVYKLNELHIQFLYDLKQSSEFLLYEITNPNFFITVESPYLNIHNELSDSLQRILSDNPLLLNNSFMPLNKEPFGNIQTMYSKYCQVLDTIVYYIYKRGYRDFGLEGEMISYIYQLENNPAIRNSTYEIRKYEREYLNRNDSAYVPVLNSLVDRLTTKVSTGNLFSTEEKTELVFLLKNYKKSFNKLVALDIKLGLKTNTGLKSDLNRWGADLEIEIKNSIAGAIKQEKVQLSRLNTLFALLLILIFISAVLISMYLSKHLVSHLEQLTTYISKIADNDFNYNQKLNIRKYSTEIRQIYMEFRNMLAQLKIREHQRDKALISAYENEKRFRDLADLLPQSIYETDKLGNLVYANNTWYSTFGYTEDDVRLGLNLIEILNTSAENNLFGNDKVENSDYVAIRKDGSKFPATVYSDTINEDSKKIGRRGIIIDSTLRNKYIETLKNETIRAITSDKHKSSFLANMSHEIRTPMNSIIGFANLLSSMQVSDEQKIDFIRHIQSSGQILLNLIDDIIDIAKIEAGEIKIKPSLCHPIRIINELCSTFEGYKMGIGKEHLKIVTLFPEEELVFKTDPFRLRQILSNLISNAIKYTEEGSVMIKCSVENSKTLEFTIEDTGIGLTKDELGSIFERFKRSKTSENKNISGTGLGLAISKNLIELLGGQMWVNSEPGVGTKFWFDLPYVRIPQEQEPLAHSTEKKNANGYNWYNRTILIAEDDDGNYEFLRMLLNRTNAHLVRAINGREVIEAVKISDDIDIVLMDIRMPFLNGYEAAKQIKEIKPHLPIIAQTAFAMEGDKEKSIMHGCDDYITKPIQPANLLAKIDQFLIPKNLSSEVENGKDAKVEYSPSDIKKN